MDTYADDLLQLFEQLDLKNVIMPRQERVLVGAVTPLMVQTEASPKANPLEVFDGFRTAMINDRAQFFLDVPSGPFFGFNRPGAKVSQGLIQSWYQQGMMCGFVDAYECIKVFSETDLTEDLKKIDIPVLVIHGDDDQVVPIQAAAYEAVKLLKNGRLVVVTGGPLALPNIGVDLVNQELSKFIEE
ncbi:hypothetical protein G647_01294 [Cladophialophora carrionii CBS 160.54]|uniref:AB hydrolase-1 domain-containing protein n=1 Tax=Cladophialophora carrionii CBS 160.54 TaxID=1279043 RepID=V9DSB2_9EURO|nr:uncharacterized protein G647_01294 [Cladophialophora carrionii CBS 160.54]ETI28842.1 hypothetical protein G647_01294 [Cladophialophora carrionii CBS 160.54]